MLTLASRLFVIWRQLVLTRVLDQAIILQDDTRLRLTGLSTRRRAEETATTATLAALRAHFPAATTATAATPSSSLAGPRPRPRPRSTREEERQYAIPMNVVQEVVYQEHLTMQPRAMNGGPLDGWAKGEGGRTGCVRRISRSICRWGGGRRGRRKRGRVGLWMVRMRGGEVPCVVGCGLGGWLDLGSVFGFCFGFGLVGELGNYWSIKLVT